MPSTSGNYRNGNEKSSASESISSTLATSTPVHSQSLSSEEAANDMRNVHPFFAGTPKFTRSRKGQTYKGKGTSTKENRLYYKEVVLLTGNNDTITPRQGVKLYLKQNNQIVRGVQFSKDWSQQQICDKERHLFEKKLEHFNFEFVESVYTELVPPTLPPSEKYDGTMLYTSFKEKILYVRPQQQVIPLPPLSGKSKRKKSTKVFEGIDDSDESYAFEPSSVWRDDDDGSLPSGRLPRYESQTSHGNIEPMNNSCIMSKPSDSANIKSFSNLAKISKEDTK